MHPVAAARGGAPHAVDEPGARRRATGGHHQVGLFELGGERVDDDPAQRALAGQQVVADGDSPGGAEDEPGWLCQPECGPP
ncbi:hypothetical protein LEP48_10605 [Isoptericola sp. NEAU-Y5]|uniref:Uncharacterized protein n=1 Tax=Isoptericola luteus TaxID=2879484 RepID=A0ABS7ZH41_9MICO|nr:hypothetical protein [Isoptericola sp. NEAU-Y5]MCA5893797.1 hypothetical protein [Isoptericola sp. NEAU-Y5]